MADRRHVPHFDNSSTVNADEALPLPRKSQFTKLLYVGRSEEFRLQTLQLHNRLLLLEKIICVLGRVGQALRYQRGDALPSSIRDHLVHQLLGIDYHGQSCSRFTAHFLADASNCGILVCGSSGEIGNTHVPDSGCGSGVRTNAAFTPLRALPA